MRAARKFENPKSDYDPACGVLAEHFLQDEPTLTDRKANLAASIQRAVEDWFLFESREAEVRVGSDAIEMPLSDVNNLDAVVHALGIEDSHVTPAEAVKMLQDKIDVLQSALSDLLKTTPDERQDPTIWFARVDAARSALGAW